jgi:hypothetical protein
MCLGIAEKELFTEAAEALRDMEILDSATEPFRCSVLSVSVPIPSN